MPGSGENNVGDPYNSASPGDRMDPRFEKGKTMLKRMGPFAEPDEELIDEIVRQFDKASMNDNLN